MTERGRGAVVTAPFASIPVRWRVTVPPPVHGVSDELTEAALTAVLLAGVVTGGTVLARARLPEHVLRTVRCSVAETGAYVVSSAAGLTATSRATGGEVASFRCTVPDHLVVLYAVAAARASATCVLTPRGGSAIETAATLVRLGLCARGAGGSVVIEPGFVAGDGVIDHAGDIYLVLATLLVGLLRFGTRIIDTVPLDMRMPDFIDTWSALLVADEFLLPGSALVPSDYIMRRP
ncbi:hypothetical protein [Nocardia sp. NPDC049526]|uniref:hypothetical protein n=1 Tax=Nocardia sp. NPDC049526 TaxID=3364316 RepID=UPI0037985D80